MKLERDYYRMKDVSALLGITNHKLWRLRKTLNFETRTRGVDKREKWVSAATITMLDDYLHTIDKEGV